MAPELPNARMLLLALTVSSPDPPTGFRCVAKLVLLSVSDIDRLLSFPTMQAESHWPLRHLAISGEWQGARGRRRYHAERWRGRGSRTQTVAQRPGRSAGN